MKKLHISEAIYMESTMKSGCIRNYWNYQCYLKRIPGQTLSFSFCSENLSSVIPLFSYFHFTLNKYEESYIPKQNKGTEWAHQNTSGQKLQRDILEDFMWSDSEIP